MYRDGNYSIIIMGVGGGEEGGREKSIGDRERGEQQDDG